MHLGHIILFATGTSILSAASAYYLTTKSLTDTTSIYNSFEVTQSGWLYSDKIGSNAASGIERAKLAIAGPLGLSSKEAVYFVATTDNQGQPLSSSCNYLISGAAIDTRWWSLTLYDTQTQYYVPNTINRSSWNSATIPTSPSGDWSITVSNSPINGTWLPSQADDDQTFELNLRVYNPSPKTKAAIPNIDFPNVEMTSC